jgi:hypothetical protein
MIRFGPSFRRYLLFELSKRFINIAEVLEYFSMEREEAFHENCKTHAPRLSTDTLDTNAAPRIRIVGPF